VLRGKNSAIKTYKMLVSVALCLFVANFLSRFEPRSGVS
jgi:hypothetical protein